MADRPIPNPRAVAPEHVYVRTQFPGQALRVALVLDNDEHNDWIGNPPDESQIVAELVIAPNHRVVVESGGLHVELIQSPSSKVDNADG